MGRITATSDPREAASGADIISESVPEIPEIKAETFALFHRLCPEHTVFTTNTSLLMPSRFAHASGRPDGLAALHFGVDHECSGRDAIRALRRSRTHPRFHSEHQAIPIMLHRENHGMCSALYLSLIQTALTLAAAGGSIGHRPRMDGNHAHTHRPLRDHGPSGSRLYGYHRLLGAEEQPSGKDDANLRPMWTGASWGIRQKASHTQSAMAGFHQREQTGNTCTG